MLDPTSAFPYTFVDNEDDFHRLIESINYYDSTCGYRGLRPCLFLDSEGRNLGKVGGQLGLLQLGFPVPAPGGDRLAVYLIDTLAFTRRELSPLCAFLTSENLIKVVWDGKMDCTELKFSLDCLIHPILDLQIVEIAHRVRESRENALFVHALLGLRKAVTQFAVLPRYQADAARAIDDVVKRQHQLNRSELWVERPLSPVMKAYASLDIHSIALLHDCFSSSKLLRPENLESLIRASERSCALFLDERRPQNAMFSNHGFLAAGLLEDPVYGEQMLRCSGCKRMISARWYHPSVVGPGVRERYCSVCQRLKLLNSQRGNKYARCNRLW